MLAERFARGKLASVLDALDEIRGIDDTDLVFRRAIELARDRIGLKRVGIFVLDPSRDLMRGTWGMDLSCSVVDEHHIVYDLCETDREALRRAADEGAHFTVFENCPIVEHHGGETRIAGRGWVAKTPIRSKEGAIGMMFNDAGLTGAPVDEANQTCAAILCSVLGTLLDPKQIRLGRHPLPARESPGERLVSSAMGMLDRDPGIGGKEIAAALNLSLSRVARVFKMTTGMSLVEYRNRLRLDRFAVLVHRGETKLLDAAREAGFGSYSQFHRVFRARLHASPRDYRTKSISLAPSGWAARRPSHPRRAGRPPPSRSGPRHSG